MLVEQLLFYVAHSAIIMQALYQSVDLFLDIAGMSSQATLAHSLIDLGNRRPIRQMPPLTKQVIAASSLLASSREQVEVEKS